ncbi:putative 15-hydroxyprostaglandin dehydrogenase [Apostichopus japonicus]|uniref:15-hydroxyprostaglandin dehydrogenase [NAD(+)] n=1 Tax=Stichopus japonicus TaxID=307972 RepID=A0A2G8LAQ0_STIJA|nr:putative 15-hydroxyprostaglandin dehydrogenase [Apostichopus japonicus]
MKVEGTVALVTGAAQGIGRSLTERLLELGAKWVSIIDIDKKLGGTLAEELAEKYGKGRVGFMWCDIAYGDKLADVFEETYKKHNRLDIVVNNAAIQDETQWEATVQVNYLAVVRGIRLAKKYMSTENGGKGGVVINTASCNGFRKAWVPVYASTKAAIISLSRCLPEGDSAFIKGGMRVGAICPGYVETVLGKAGNIYFQMTIGLYQYRKSIVRVKESV